MSVERTNLTWTLILRFLTGALCSPWKVEYQQQHICAVKGSSVFIPCSFYYPDNLKVTTVKWREANSHFKGSSRNLIHISRFQYIGDKCHNCSLKIHKVQHNDTGKYIFRFITNSEEGKWTGKVGSTLKVVDLNISVTKPHGNRRTKEGDSLNLTCIDGCDGGNLSSAFAWFKNGERIHEGPVLYLGNMSFTHSGNYTCSLKKHTGTTSGVMNIDVEYGPKNTSVSVRPSMEVNAGSNITLVCSSHANPPVENYTWFKVDDIMIDVAHQPVYVTRDCGQYLCSATNKHGIQNSNVVTLKCKECWTTFRRDVLLIAGVAVLLTVPTAIAIRRCNKKRTKAPETECEEDIQNTDYVNWPFLDNNHSQEGNGREGVTPELIYTTVEFCRESQTEEQMDSHNDDEGVIYSTVCRGQLFDHSCNETL